jgi:hypothetical protein
MAEDGGGSNTGIVAVLVIFVIVIVLAFLAWQGGLFRGRSTRINVNVSAPQPSQQQPPAAPRSSP